MSKIFTKAKMLLLLILLVGAFFRFFAVDWDQGQHLHPDERFLTMVATSMKMPNSFVEYMDPQVSTFNPATIGYPFYVYGVFPITITKLLAVGLGADNYMDITLLGRILSGFADLLIIIFLFKTILFFEKKYKLSPSIKYWSALFYAIAVLPIQLSHFFAVDTFLNLFLFGAFYFALQFSSNKKTSSACWSALLFGLALASKISAIYMAPLLAYLFFKPYLITDSEHAKKHDRKNIFKPLLLFILIVYVVGRIADPYLFQSGNFLDPRISSLFLTNLETLKSWSTPDALFPPAVQWVHKIPVLFSLTNIFLWGLGVVYFMFMLIGLYQTFKKIQSQELKMISLWMLLFFLYQSIQFANTMRYFIILYPFFALFAAIGFYEITKTWNRLPKALLFFSAVLWTLFFFSIYTKPHTRNDATVWIYQNIPDQSIILSEHWDDALPLGINPPSSKRYTSEQLPVFDPDSPQKWEKLNIQLDNGDYLILSSNRGWGSIPTVPERYPQMTQFYKDLFAGKTSYKKVAEFTSYPSLQYLGIPISIPDDISEEAFTVYDHPKVLIFKNSHE